MSLPAPRGFPTDTLVVDYDNGSRLLVPYLSRETAQIFLDNQKGVKSFYVVPYHTLTIEDL